MAAVRPESVGAAATVPHLVRVPQQWDSRRRRKFAQYVVGELGDTRSTAFTYEQNLLRVERFVGKDAADLDVDDVRGFMRASPYHPSSKNGSLVALKAYVKFLMLEGSIDTARAMRLLALRGPRQRRRPKRPLRLDQVNEVLRACRTPNEFRVIYLGLFQGLRVSDSANIRREHFGHDRLTFRSVKGDKDLELPLHSEVARVADIILDGAPTRDTLKMTCRSLSYYTGISFTSHTLRHTYSRRLDDLGIQEGVVIELLGQEQVSVYRRHYADVSWEAMAWAAAQLHYGSRLAVESDGHFPVARRCAWEVDMDFENVQVGEWYQFRLKNGSTYRGEITQLGDAEITLLANDGATISFARDVVQEILEAQRA